MNSPAEPGTPAMPPAGRCETEAEGVAGRAEGELARTERRGDA